MQPADLSGVADHRRLAGGLELDDHLVALRGLAKLHEVFGPEPDHHRVTPERALEDLPPRTVLVVTGARGESLLAQFEPDRPALLVGHEGQPFEAPLQGPAV